MPVWQSSHDVSTVTHAAEANNRQEDDAAGAASDDLEVLSADYGTALQDCQNQR